MVATAGTADPQATATMGVLPRASDAHPEPIPDKPDHPLLRQVLGRTAPVNKNVKRPRLYNHDMLWYAKPDGDIVYLQGDPGNLAYYKSKGYEPLRPEEAEQWMREVRPLVLREQQRRASIISTLRRIAQKHPGVEVAGDPEITPTEELEGMLTQIRQMTGGAVAVVSGRFREEQDPSERQYGGVEAHSIDELHGKMARAAAAQATGRRGG